jgi:hypothetical protein
MSDYQFASEQRWQNDLFMQIVDAVKEWRLAALDHEKMSDEWHAEADPVKKEALWDQTTMREVIRDGALAKMAMLADRYISEGN